MLDFALLMLVWFIVWAGSRGENKTFTEAQRRKAWKDDMTDIDPVTGDYTSRYDGLRRNKYGSLKRND